MAKVLFVSGREPTYVRAALLLRALRASYEVVEISSRSRSTLRRLLDVTGQMSVRRPRCDVAVAGFFGQPLVPLLKAFGHSPIVLDAFVSAYDTLCFDRRVFGPNSIGGRLAYWLDKSACRLSSRIVTDTRSHARYFEEAFVVPSSKTSVLYLGHDSRHFFPRQKEGDGSFLVFYYGTYLPLHGIEYIVKAAKLLENEKDIRFLIVGKGSAYSSIRRLADTISVRNVEFLDWIPYEDLPKAISHASVCLGGHFSGVEKAGRVISGKTFQFLAMERPTIVGDSAATRELLHHMEDVYMCPVADEFGLADAILALRRDSDLRDYIARGGRALAVSLFDDRVVERNVRAIVDLALSQEG